MADNFDDLRMSMNHSLYGYFMEDKAVNGENRDARLGKLIDQLTWRNIEELREQKNRMEERRVSRSRVLQLETLEKRIEELKRKMEKTHILHHELTPLNHNTILHVAVQFGHVNNVKRVLQERPQLVLQQNKKRETPLHMAAREGRADIVEELIQGAQKFGKKFLNVKKMLKATNDDGDTALHMAARNCHLEGDYLAVVLKLLLKQEGECWDQDFQHPPNNVKETPLYLAAERGNKGMAMAVVSALLDNCESLSYTGPRSRTALHAVALKDFSIGQRTIQELLTRQKDLMNKADEDGWTPFHYAACSGNFRVMEEFLLYCPDCWENVDQKGQNILHISVQKNLKNVIDYIVNKPWVRHLINQKNNDGNTPLHLLVASDYNVDELWKHREADRHVFNGDDKTPIDLLWSTILKTSNSTFSTVDDTFLKPENEGGRNIASKAHDKLATLRRLREQRLEAQAKEERMKLEAKKKEETKQDEARKASTEVYQSLVVVATLIASISSAAAFAMPGGYDGNQGRDQGMAVLARAAAFKAFIITNTIALSSSVTSILLCLNALYYYSMKKDDSDITRRYAIAGFLVLFAIFSLVLAFITAAFAVLAHSIAIAVSACVIAFTFACIGFIIFFLDLGTFLHQLLGTFLHQLLRPSKPETEATDNGNGA